MATYYWIGGTSSDVSNPANWSTTAGGGGGPAGPPGSADTAVFQTLGSGYTVTFLNGSGFQPAVVQVQGTSTDPVTLILTDGITVSQPTTVTVTAGGYLFLDTTGTVATQVPLTALGGTVTIDVGMGSGGPATSTYSNENLITAAAAGRVLLEATADGTYANTQGVYAAAPNGVVEVSTALPDRQSVAFLNTATYTGIGGILQIDSGGSVAGAIAGFQGGDEIYLAGVTWAATDTFSFAGDSTGGGALTISDGTHTQTLNLEFGAYATSGASGTIGASGSTPAGTNLTFSQSPGGGIDIFTSVIQPVWKAGSGEWNTAGDWTTGTIPTATQTALITGNGGSSAYTVTIGASDTGAAAAAPGVLILDDSFATLDIIGRLQTQVLVIAAGTLTLGKNSSVFGRIDPGPGATNATEVLDYGGTVNFSGGDLQFVNWVGTFAMSAANSSVHVLEPGGAGTGGGALQGLQVQNADGTPGTVLLTGTSASLVFNDYQTFDNATVYLGNATSPGDGLVVGESNSGANGLGGSQLTLGAGLAIESANDGPDANSATPVFGGINYSVPTTITDQMTVISQAMITWDAALGSSFGIFSNWKGTGGTAPIFLNEGSLTVGGGTTVNQHGVFVNEGSISLITATAEFQVLNTNSNTSSGNGVFYDQGGSISMANGATFDIVPVVTGTLAGAFIGYGTITGAILLGGTLTANPAGYDGTATTGSLTITGAVSGTGTATIDSGMTLSVGGTYMTSGGIIFQDHATLILGNPGGAGTSYANPFSGFDYHDTMQLNGVGANYTSASFAYNSGNSGPGTLTLYNGGAAANYLLTDFSVAADVIGPTLAGKFIVTNDGAGDNTITIACFAEGTRIATADGAVRVEELRAGDAVRTPEGAREIVWIGRRRIELARHPHPGRARPVRIRRDAFAAGVPSRDLLLSPDHAVYWDGVLVEAKRLINGTTITQDAPDAVTYFHIELERHDILFAEDLPAESYLDTGNRGIFENGGEALILHPDLRATPATRARFTCAPMAFEGETLAGIRRHLLDRAQALGFATTDDPGLYVLADGRRIEAQILPDGRRRFSVPKGTTALRLRSRTGVPGHLLADVDDDRTVGAFIGAITVNSASGRREIALDDAALHEGWHAPEATGRWTNGDAALNVAGPCLLEITLAGALPYPNLRRRAA